MNLQQILGPQMFGPQLFDSQTLAQSATGNATLAKAGLAPNTTAASNTAVKQQTADSVDVGTQQQSTALSAIGQNCVAADNAALSSAADKLSLGVMALTSDGGIDDLMTQLVKSNVENTNQSANEARDSIKSNLEQIQSQNKQELKKMEERAKELEKSEQQSGCVKVLNVVAEVAKAVGSAASGNFGALAMRTAAAVMKIVGKENLAQTLGGIASAMDNPINAGIIDTNKDELSDKINEMHKEGHLANAEDLLADMKEIAANRESATARQEDGIETLTELMGIQKQEIGSLNSQLESQAQVMQRAQQILSGIAA